MIIQGSQTLTFDLWFNVIRDMQLIVLLGKDHVFPLRIIKRQRDTSGERSLSNDKFPHKRLTSI